MNLYAGREKRGKKMKKKIVALLFALPAIAIFSIFKIIPAVQAIIETIESASYMSLIENPEFPIILKSTLFLSSVSIAFTCLLAVLLIIFISRLPGRIAKTCAIVLIAIPAFIPVISFTSVYMDLFSVNGTVNQLLMTVGLKPVMFFADSALYPFLYAALEAIRNVYVPVIIGVLVCESSRNRSAAGRIALAITGYAAARVMMILSPNTESILMTSNPLVHDASDILDLLIFRTGFTAMDLSTSNAIWTVKMLLQLTFNIVFLFLLYMVIPDITNYIGKLGERKDIVGKTRRSIVGIIGSVLFGAASVTMICMTFIPKGEGFVKAMEMLLRDSGFLTVFSNTLWYCLLSSIIYGLMTLLLAYPLNVSKVFYPLLLVILISLGNNTVGEYLLFKRAGIVDTIFPVIISSAISVTGAFALHFSISAGKLKGANLSNGQYFKAALAPLAVIVVLNFIMNWGSFYYQNIYLLQPSLYSIGQYGYQHIMFPDQPGTIAANGIQLSDIRSAYIFISSAIPAALGLILISLNKFLPLTAFSADMRKS